MTFDLQAGWNMAALDQENIAELSRGLHQAAQPLTALQGWLELALVGSHTEDEYKASIRQAMEESRRVLACFDRVREMARRPHPASANSGFVASAVVRAVLERFGGDFAAAGVEIVFHPLPEEAEVDDLVRGSESRVSTALSLILSSSFPFLESSDQLEVSIHSLPETVDISVLARKHNSLGETPREELIWRIAPLELAQALVVSTGGTVTLDPSAFSVVISLSRIEELCGSKQTRDANV
jgi:signal transduction histidine kinase